MSASGRDSLSHNQRQALFAHVEAREATRTMNRRAPNRTNAESASTNFANLPAYADLQLQKSVGHALGLENPFYRVHDGRAASTTVIAGQPYLNFASYDYLGLNGHLEVMTAAKAALDRYGVSCSASRLVGGERAVHRSLEQSLARLYDADDCIALVSGHATNVMTVAHLLEPGDLVLVDSQIHNSVQVGAKLSGAERRTFPHNDAAALDGLLSSMRRRYRRALIVLEGLYSMDGDVPDLPAMIEIKRRHDAWLMIDEAHALGVLGHRGLGIAEHFGVDPRDVDVWMGTLSKTLAGCGGYIAGSAELVEYLRYTAGGFIYSVGMAPALAAASETAIGIMLSEPGRVQRLQSNSRLFLECARKESLNTGTSIGLGIIPVYAADSLRAAALGQQLFNRGVYVLPILPPAVPDCSARLRFFITADHTENQIRDSVEVLVEEMADLARGFRPAISP
jgi:8-amino-7-oxononanoate synthase